MGRFIVIGFILLIQLMLVFQDTPEFQQAMKFLVSGDPSFTLPAIWMDNRAYAISGIILFLLFHYRSSLHRYKTAVQTYDIKHLQPIKPALSPQLASYIFLQDRSLIMVIWLIKWCQAGVLKLHYGKLPHPWSVSRKEGASCDTNLDQQMLEILFRDKNSITIRNIGNMPHPDVSVVAGKLFDQTKSEAKKYLPTQTRIAIMAWLVFIALLIEISFLQAHNPSHLPGQLFLQFGLAVFVAGGTILACRLLPSLFTDLWWVALLLISFGLLIATLPHYMASSISPPYFEMTVYFNVVVILGILFHQAPLVTQNITLLKNIIGYKTI